MRFVDKCLYVVVQMNCYHMERKLYYHNRFSEQTLNYTQRIYSGTYSLPFSSSLLLPLKPQLHTVGLHCYYAVADIDVSREQLLFAA